MKYMHKNKKSSKQIWAGWIVIGCVILQLLFFVLFTLIGNYVAYSIDNYRYLFSSLLQVIGSMFAFIASSTLVAYQFIASFSPNSVNYYPQKLFILFLSVTLIVVGIDVSAILLLKTECTQICKCVYDSMASLNTYPVAMALIYVVFVIRTITPRSQLSHLLKKAKKATNNAERADIVYAIEEIIISAVRNGQGGYIRECQDALSDVIDIYSSGDDPLNCKFAHNPSHPLRILPDVIERISYSLVDNNMGNLLHYNGHILRKLSGKRYAGKVISGVEVASAIEHIGIYCLEHKQLDDFYNFIADVVFCLNSNNSYSTVFWGCKLLITAAKARIEAHPVESLKLIRYVINNISHAVKHEDIPDRAKKEIVNYFKSLSWLRKMAAQYKDEEIQNLMDEITTKRVRVTVKCP